MAIGSDLDDQDVPFSDIQHYLGYFYTKVRKP